MHHQIYSEQDSGWPQSPEHHIVCLQYDENSKQIRLFPQLQYDRSENGHNQHHQPFQQLHQNDNSQSNQESKIKKISIDTSISLIKQNIDQRIQKFLVDEQQENSNSESLLKDPKIKKKQFAKKYRDKKRQYLRSLEDQNRILRKKIDDLSFRLNQAQFTINRLKFGNESHTRQFQKKKEDCLKEIQRTLSSKNIKPNQISEAQKKLQEMICFTGKQKIDILNYYMSEFLQNAVDDREIYFLDCILNKRGVYRQNRLIPLRKIDQQLLQIFNVKKDISGEEFFKKQVPESLAKSGLRLKYYWQQLYLNYLKLLNEGYILQNFVDPFKQKIKNNIDASIPLKVQLFFQKSKFRPDMRQLRKEWFNQLHSEQDIKKQLERVQYLASKFNQENF